MLYILYSIYYSRVKQNLVFSRQDHLNLFVSGSPCARIVVAGTKTHYFKCEHKRQCTCLSTKARESMPYLRIQQPQPLRLQFSRFDHILRQ